MAVALVTGGARGMGRAIVAALAAEHDIAYSFCATEPGEDTPGTPIRADLAEEDAPAALVAAVPGRFGRLDILVDTAGAALPAPPEATDLVPHRAMLEHNVLAPMALLAAAQPHLGQGASVVNITSTNARLPALSAPASSASKAALECSTRAMAKALGPRGIRVNAFALGAVEYPESPRPADLRALFEVDIAFGTLAVADDIAAAVRFLAAPAAQAITGQILDVDGGYRL